MNFLISQYQFEIDEELYSPEVMGNAYVRYISANAGVMVVCDRNQAFAQVGPRSWPEKEWFQLEDIVRNFNPGVENVYRFDKSVDEQLRLITSYLIEVCEPLILGDFSMCKYLPTPRR